MVKGEYKIGDTLDIPRFMSLFESYRQERHTRLMEYRENEHLQYKALGDSSRTTNSDPLEEHFAKLGDTMSALRDNVKELRKENTTLKKVDDF